MAGNDRQDDTGHGSPAQSGAEIVSLAEMARDTRFPVLAELETYWQALRGNRLVPARSEVDPRKIEDALEYAFILERIAPGMGRFRLAGMHLNDLMGMEVRGMPLTAFFTPEARKQVNEALEEVFDAPAIARLTLAGERGIGRPPIDARLLLLPLKSDFGDVSRALGCLVTLGPVGRTPRRFEVSRHEVVPLAGPEHAGDPRIKGWSEPKKPTAGRKGAHDVPGTDTHPAHTSGLAESVAPYAADTHEAQSERPSGRPHLYLVKNDD